MTATEAHYVGTHRHPTDADAVVIAESSDPAVTTSATIPPLDDSDIEADTGDLGRRASRGAVVMMAGQLARVLVQTIGVIILARPFTPTAFGLTTTVVAIIGVGEIFRDFGLSLAAIQARNVTRSERDNLFWVNTAIGLLLAIIVFLCAGLIADIYNDDRPAHVGQVLAVTFLLNGASAQYRSSLQRDLRFVLVTVADVLGIAVGIVVGVGLALAHYGYWAIVWDNVAQAAATLVFVVVVSRWLPRRYDRHTSIRRFAVFGVNVLLAQIIGYGGRNADSITIGIRSDPLPSGSTTAPSICSRCRRISSTSAHPCRDPRAVAAAEQTKRHSRLSRDWSDRPAAHDPARAGRDGRAGRPRCPPGAWPPVASGDPAVPDPGYCGLVPDRGYVTYWVFLSKGLTRESLYLSLVSRPLGIAFIVIGAHWGVTGVAWGYAAGQALNWPLSMWWISRCSDAPVRRLLWNGLAASSATPLRP